MTEDDGIDDRCRYLVMTHGTEDEGDDMSKEITMHPLLHLRMLEVVDVLTLSGLDPEEKIHA